VSEPYDQQLSYAWDIINAVNAQNPQGQFNAFLAASALAGISLGPQLAAFASGFAEGISAADTLLLGSGPYVDAVTGVAYSGYIEIGGVVGASTVNIPADVWSAMSLAEQQAALTGGITEALNSGAQVAYTSNPALATGWTQFEYNFLINSGYKIVQQGTSWVVVP
jgi:hypothetical protein